MNKQGATDSATFRALFKRSLYRTILGINGFGSIVIRIKTNQFPSCFRDRMVNGWGRDCASRKYQYLRFRNVPQPHEAVAGTAEAALFYKFSVLSLICSPLLALTYHMSKRIGLFNCPCPRIVFLNTLHTASQNILFTYLFTSSLAANVTKYKKTYVNRQYKNLP